MGTIVPRLRRDGTTGYTAQICMRRDGTLAHTEGKTFDRKQAAVSWLKRREGELQQPGAFERSKIIDPPLADVIDRYVDESEKTLGRTKAQVLCAIKRDDIGSLRCSMIGSAEIVTFLRGLDTKPQTRANYLAHLGAVFAVAAGVEIPARH